MRADPFAGISRREFLAKAIVVGGTGLTVACSSAAPEPAPASPPAPTAPRDAAAPSFPRLAGMLISSPHSYDDSAYQKQIARLDLAILGMYNMWAGSGGATPAASVNAIKALNPNILLGNYTNMTEVPSDVSDVATDELRAKLNAGTGPRGVGDWWAYTANGQHTSHFGHDTWNTNLTLLTTPDDNGDHWPQWLATRDDALISGADFDIWYSDNCLPEPPMTADWDRDGVDDAPDSPAARTWWRDGQRAYYDRARSIEPNKFLMLNTVHDLDGSVRPGGQSYTQYSKVAHGAYLEMLIGQRWSAETPPDGWAKMMAWYHHVFVNLLSPKMVVFNAMLVPTDYQTLRYAFGSCLLDDGYFSVSDDHYHNVLWFDEFDLAGTSHTKWLGQALDPPQSAARSNGVYRREFANGLVLVNPKGNGSQSVDVGAGFRRLSGTQDSATNNGELVTSTVALADRDGLILVRAS